LGKEIFETPEVVLEVDFDLDCAAADSWIKEQISSKLQTRKNIQTCCNDVNVLTCIFLKQFISGANENIMRECVSKITNRPMGKPVTKHLTVKSQANILYDAISVLQNIHFIPSLPGIALA